MDEEVRKIFSTMQYDFKFIWNEIAKHMRERTIH